MQSEQLRHQHDAEIAALRAQAEERDAELCAQLEALREEARLFEEMALSRGVWRWRMLGASLLLRETRLALHFSKAGLFASPAVQRAAEAFMQSTLQAKLALWRREGPSGAAVCIGAVAMLPSLGLRREKRSTSVAFCVCSVVLFPGAAAVVWGSSVSTSASGSGVR